MADVPQSILVSESGFRLPISEIMTGRGFVTGKSGSGKSNSASVIAEELLEHGLPMLIVDTDGEYYGLKSRYELLHVGAEADCDATVGIEHAEKLAELALLQNVPIILDISGYVEESERRELVRRVIERLFELGKRARKPFLVFVEEVHEFLPETGKVDELANTLITVAKRGRKRGIGICGMSQRPAAVDKDFITQCDWIVWHRLTWENDKRVVAQMLGSEAAADIDELLDGEALLMTDWDDRINRIRFRRKRTFDAGATPDLDDIDAGGYSPVPSALINELADEDADLNAIDIDGLAGAREVPDERDGDRDGDAAGGRELASVTPDEPGTADGPDASDEVNASGEPAETPLEAAAATAIDEPPRDVVTIPSRPAYVPPEPTEDEPFDPVWELGHLMVYLSARFVQGVAALAVGLAALLAVVGRPVAPIERLVRRDAERVGGTIRRWFVSPAVRELEDVAAHRLPDRLIAAMVVVLLATAFLLLFVN